MRQLTSLCSASVVAAAMIRQPAQPTILPGRVDIRGQNTQRCPGPQDLAPRPQRPSLCKYKHAVVHYIICCTKRVRTSTSDQCQVLVSKHLTSLKQMPVTGSCVNKLAANGHMKNEHISVLTAISKQSCMFGCRKMHCVLDRGSSVLILA